MTSWRPVIRQPALDRGRHVFASMLLHGSGVEHSIPVTLARSAASSKPVSAPPKRLFNASQPGCRSSCSCHFAPCRIGPSGPRKGLPGSGEVKRSPSSPPQRAAFWVLNSVNMRLDISITASSPLACLLAIGKPVHAVGPSLASPLATGVRPAAINLYVPACPAC